VVTGHTATYHWMPAPSPPATCTSMLQVYRYSHSHRLCIHHTSRYYSYSLFCLPPARGHITRFAILSAAPGHYDTLHLLCPCRSSLTFHSHAYCTIPYALHHTCLSRLPTHCSYILPCSLISPLEVHCLLYYRLLPSLSYCYRFSPHGSLSALRLTAGGSGIVASTCGAPRSTSARIGKQTRHLAATRVSTSSLNAVVGGVSIETSATYQSV